MYQKMFVPGKNTDNGIENLRRVLARAEENGLLMNWRKCTFFADRILFLGFIIKNCTIKPSNKKTEAVRKFPAWMIFDDIYHNKRTKDKPFVGINFFHKAALCA